MTTTAPSRARTPRPVPPAGRAAAATGRGAHPTAILAVILVGAAAAIGLWWNNTPSVRGTGDWLTNAGRITGLLAGYGIVVLVALMARVPALERGIGADKLARWHAMGGRYVVSLVVSHALLITWGYAVQAHTDVVHQTKTLLLSYPDVLMASVAGLLLVMVGVVSARAARRRMRYETWYFLHFYTYLAAALAFSHQFATGAEFINDRAARVAWSTLYVVVFAAVLWYRFVVPVRQFVRHDLRVLAIRRESPTVVSIVVGGKHVDELQAQAGQFFRWRFLTRELWYASNPYSLSAAPRAGQLRITVEDLGEHSRALRHLKVGTRVSAEGPYGAMTAARRRQNKVLLIAGGIGITPLRALFESLPARARELTLLYRVSDERDIIFRRELEEIARVRGARLILLAGRRRDLGHDPLSTESLTTNIPDLRDHDVYVCGSEGMAASVIKNLRAAKVPQRQIHHESFAF
ncbi:MAG: ferredoxin reductase family protein [Jatrophihabitans sp.]|uniref:ferredoxin reductase family protein n=1 Tax=Jatrophihabitans sp. TaxID=1932789 RepID=UPI003F7CFD42